MTNNSLGAMTLRNVLHHGRLHHDSALIGDSAPLAPPTVPPLAVEFVPGGSSLAQQDGGDHAPLPVCVGREHEAVLIGDVLDREAKMSKTKRLKN